MSQALEILIAKARKYRMTDEERDAQVRSFAYGNTHFENPAIKRCDIAEAQKALQSERACAVAVPQRD
jgi:hypothetical protein